MYEGMHSCDELSQHILPWFSVIILNISMFDILLLIEKQVGSVFLPNDLGCLCKHFNQSDAVEVRLCALPRPRLKSHIDFTRKLQPF
jgi:hypothetical protein